jgi:hypothetical protein
MLDLSLRLTTAPVTWSVELVDAPANLPWPLLLDEIAQSRIKVAED